MKHLTIITSSLLLLTYYISLLAAVPLRWTVETSRAQPATFDEFAGATYDLEATLQSYGRPLEVVGEPHLYWQTNGMGSAYWTAPATVSGNVLRATWTPACDVGARAYNCFIGITGTVYNAAFQLRLRPSPGATPNVIEQPPRVLDLDNTIVINPPWPTDETIDARIREVIDEGCITAPVETNVVTSIITNTVTKHYVEDLGISGVGTSGVDTNAVRDIALWPSTNYTDRLVGNLASNVSRLASSKANADYVPPAISNATTRINADLTVTEREHFSEWAINYEGPYWDESYDPGIYPRYLESDDEQAMDGAGWYFSYDNGLSVGSSQINFTDRNATHLMLETSLSWGTVTAVRHLVPEQTTKLTTTNDLTHVADDAHNAYLFSKSINLYMTSNTNAWFAGTNYVFGADAMSRNRFAWEHSMDASTVPCSMALYENRDGVRQCVWDQRDWTAWYWSFKADQMRRNFAATNALIYATITNDANNAWARRYAATGRSNPDADTTYIDTKAVCLSPGMNWETVATVSGCGYWTIVGNGAVIGGSSTNAVLDIKDFEGNSILRIAKGEHRLAWLESSDSVGQMTDSDGWVCFDIMASVQPVGYFSTTLISSDFVPETDASCPAQFSWEDLGQGMWRVHFLLKPGIDSNTCFAKFLVEIEGKTQIEYTAGVAIKGGLIYNGVTIAPVIPQNAAIGDTITWKVIEK